LAQGQPRVEHLAPLADMAARQSRKRIGSKDAVMLSPRLIDQTPFESGAPGCETQSRTLSPVACMAGSERDRGEREACLPAVSIVRGLAAAAATAAGQSGMGYRFQRRRSGQRTMVRILMQNGTRGDFPLQTARWVLERGLVPPVAGCAATESAELPSRCSPAHLRTPASSTLQAFF
jgi:hypothetical protein